jgi:membrane-associated progesterone receptor component
MAENTEANNADSADSGGIFTNVLLEIVRSPINIALVGVIILLVYKIYKSRQPVAGETQESTPELPKLRKDFTVEELKEHSGDGPDGRILIAVNGKVFDVTKGKRFYGPG